MPVYEAVYTIASFVHKMSVIQFIKHEEGAEYHNAKGKHVCWFAAYINYTDTSISE